MTKKLAAYFIFLIMSVEIGGIGGLSEKIGDIIQTGLDILTKYEEAKLYSRAKYIPIRPLNAIADEGPFKFIVGGYESPDVVMLNSLRLSSVYS